MANGKHPNHANSTTTEAHTKCQIHLQRQNVLRQQMAPDRVFQVTVTVHIDFLGFILTLLFPDGSKKLYGPFFLWLITYSASDLAGRSFCKSVRTLQFTVALLKTHTVTAIMWYTVRSFVKIGTVKDVLPWTFNTNDRTYAIAKWKENTKKNVWPNVRERAQAPYTE